LSGLERIQQAEGVVYPYAAGAEEIPVIVCPQTFAGLVESLPVGRSKLLDILTEVFQEFFFAYPADVRIIRIPGYILQVVQVTEHAYFPELRYPGQLKK